MCAARSKDLTGQVFGQLTVVGRSDKRAPRGKRTVALWECRCTCGATAYRATDTLKRAGERMCAACAGKANAAKARACGGFVNGTQVSRLSGSEPNATNKSGARGVNFDAHSGLWRARIKFRHQNINLGYFRDLNDAVAARKAAEEQYFGPLLEEKAQ